MLAFVHIYKCGGTTIKSILRRNFGSRHFDTGLLYDRRNLNAAQLHRVRWFFPSLASIAGHEVRPFSDLRKEVPDIRYYTFLREPKDRAISAFRAKVAYRIADKGWSPGAEEIETAMRSSFRTQRNKMCGAFSVGGILDEAKEVLDRDFGFIGMIEQFDASLALLNSWSGEDMDLRYVRLNTGDERTLVQRRLRPHRDMIARADAVLHALIARAEFEDLLDLATADDRALVQHARALKFRPQIALEAGASLGTFATVHPPNERLLSKLHRDLIGRPLVPLVTRSLAR